MASRLPAPPPKPHKGPAPRPTPKTLPYNPAGYVPGGSSAKVAQTIEAQALTTPGPTPAQVPASVLKSIPAGILVTTPAGEVVPFKPGATYPYPGAEEPPPPPPPTGSGASDADRFLAGADPLDHLAAFQAITAACDLYGIETKAACANGLHEGFHGGIGDSGSAYGPWQEHLTDGRIPEIAGLDRYDERVQRWAWSGKGIAHGVRGMAEGAPSARGLNGHAAVHAIVYGFEKPGDEAGAYQTRADEYDHLVRLGQAWQAYVIANLIGMGLPGTTPTPLTPPFGEVPATPTGAQGAWRALMVTIGTTLPRLGVEARRTGSNLPGV